jgi:ubiquilin
VNLAAGGAQTNTTRSTPIEDARAQAPAGLGGLGLPGLEGMLGAMPDATSVNQLLQNPAISQMMQSILSNPQYMNQVFSYYATIQDLTRSSPMTLFASPSFSISCASSELTCLTLLNFQIIALNPQMRGFLDSNSQLREMMQNPEVLRQLTSPETMQVHKFKVLQL